MIILYITWNSRMETSLQGLIFQIFRNDTAEEMARDNVFLISCQNETGIHGLKHHIEKRILQATGRGRIIINIDQTGGELR